MSLSLALNNALSGLYVAQKSLAVLSNNVANANTEGYSRQIVQQSPQTKGGQGAGVLIENVVRKIDEYLVGAIRTQTSTSGQAGISSDYMSRIQILMGDPGGTNSLDQYMGTFFNTMQSLSQNPEQSSLRYQAVNTGKTLATNISSLANNLEDLRYQADSDIQAAIHTINDEILHLHDINNSIFRAKATGEPVSNLLDTRDISLKKISEYLDIHVNQANDGEVSVYTNGGSPILENLPYQLQYNGVNSVDTFKNNGTIAPITVDAMRESGELIGQPQTLVSSGINTDISTKLTGGKLKGLLDIRDQEIPHMLSQLDEIAAKIRDSFNAIHNSGSGLPAATSLTGTRAVGYDDESEWTGQLRIAVLNKDGSAPASRYSNSTTGFTPLTLDLDTLRSEFGKPITTQTLLDEINQHFLPQNKAQVGNLSNIQMAAMSPTIPDTGSTFKFDLDLENTSATTANLWVSNITVLDDTAANITAYAATYPAQFNLDAVNTFSTSAGSNVVTIAATGNSLKDGDVVYINSVGGVVDGIPASDFNAKAFHVTNVTANSFDIEVATQASLGTFTSDATATALQSYATHIPGGQTRTSADGDVTLDLSGNPASQYYIVKLDVMQEDDRGNFTNATVEYRIPNNQTAIINQRYSTRGVTGGGSMIVPTNSNPLLRAQLVDADGNVVPSTQKGFLQLVAQSDPYDPTAVYTVAIDDLDSVQNGLPNDAPPIKGTGRGFSHYFDLNDFFVSNDPNITGDTVAGSALNMRVRQNIIDDPNIMGFGTLTKTPNGPTGAPDYSYERAPGNGDIAKRLAKLSTDSISFDAAGGLPASNKSLISYSSEVLAFAASRADAADSTLQDQETLLKGFNERSAAISGVNIDEEMANTIIYQHAYSASAQVINVVKTLFDTLIQSF